MRDKKIILFTLILGISFLTGCWDSYEITQYTLLSLVGIDKVNGNVMFALEYNTPSNQSESSAINMGKKSKILYGEGKDLVEARHSYLRRNANKVFIGSIRAIVFSDSYSKGGIEEYLNRIRGIREYSKTVNLFTTTTEIDKLFSSAHDNSLNIGYDIEHLNEALVSEGLFFDSEISIIVENALVENAGYIIDNLDLVNNKIEMTGYSIFNQNKKIGFIPESKINGINYIILKNAYAEYIIDLDNITIALSAALDKRKIKVYYDDENILFKIKIDLKCELINLSKMITLDDEKLKKLEEKISNIAKQEILSAIQMSQSKYGCDYLYLYKYFRAVYNTDFKNMNWNEKYKDAIFEIDVQAKVAPGNLVRYD